MLWFNDGLWWGNLWDTASSDFHIFKFNAAASSWVDTGVVTETRASTHHDVLWDGATLFVASYRFVNDGLPAEPNFPTTMRRYSYDPANKTYSLLSSTQINNSKVEVLTIDKDSTGRVWATWQQGNRIYLNVTATDGKTWWTPFAHPAALSNVSVDDTSAVIAFDGNKMGVMWSRQVGDATDGMYWSYHLDGASNTAWSAPVAAVSGQRSSDDHMNLKWLDSSGGRVFAAVKTSFTSAPEPLIQLLALSGATWSAYPIAAVSECPNRVIVLIDESTQMLRTFATYPKPSGTTNAGVCTSLGGAIYEKSTPLNDINFTTAKTTRIVDAGEYVHNVTSTKQNLNSAARGTANSGLLVLADVSATSTYWHFYDPPVGGGDTTAPTVTDTSPVAGAAGVAVSADVTGSFSEAMDPATVTSSTFTLTAGTTPVTATVTYDATGKVATLNPGADLAAGTTYTATIKGGPGGVKDVAGNALASDKTWTFTTLATPASVRASAAGSGELTASGSYTPTLPAGWQPGDVVFLYSQVTVSGSANTTTPAGWTRAIADFTSAGSTSAHQTVWYRVMQSGDTAPSVAEPASRYAWTTVAVQGADATTPLDVTPTTDTNSGVPYPDVRAPSITPVTPGALLLTAHGVRNGTNSATTAFTPPSGTAEVSDVTSNVASKSNAAIEVDSLSLTDTSTTGTKTATAASSSGTIINQCGSAIVVRPALP
ncbi:Ig-like domain-containing protein [Arthrobacter sp. ISL-48]|uniref:Ig-like domain-containing protein n=1 Tax=Arthrobacter sp. ISL-48 TaxID=2819110 RepID=UPI00288A0A16|nr:Ig-like domain-containing protein [Arthrobacter sp. ISL-48]